MNTSPYKLQSCLPLVQCSTVPTASFCYILWWLTLKTCVFCPHGISCSVWNFTVTLNMSVITQHCIFNSDKDGLFLWGRNWILGVLYTVEEKRLRRTRPSVCNLVSATDFFWQFYKIQYRGSASCLAAASLLKIGSGKAAIFPWP
jgi:hypothetical protein